MHQHFKAAAASCSLGLMVLVVPHVNFCCFLTTRNSIFPAAVGPWSLTSSQIHQSKDNNKNLTMASASPGKITDLIKSLKLPKFYQE